MHSPLLSLTHVCVLQLAVTYWICESSPRTSNVFALDGVSVSHKENLGQNQFFQKFEDTVLFAAISSVAVRRLSYSDSWYFIPGLFPPFLPRTWRTFSLPRSFVCVFICCTEQSLCSFGLSIFAFLSSPVFLSKTLIIWVLCCLDQFSNFSHIFSPVLHLFIFLLSFWAISSTLISNPSIGFSFLLLF